MIQIGIQSEVLQQIIDGRKTIEGRLGKEKFLRIKIGDELSIREDIYENGKIVGEVEDRLHLKIDGITKFHSFEQMLREAGYEKAIPTAKSLSDAVAAYRTYYSEDDENEYGVIGLEFHVIDKKYSRSASFV